MTQRRRTSAHSSLLLMIVLALVVAIKLGVIDRISTPIRPTRLQDGALQDIDVTSQVTFGEEFVLLGHEGLPARVPSGGEFTLTSYWQALEPKGPDYGVKVVLRGPQGHRWNDDGYAPRWHRAPPPVREWPPEQYALLALAVPLLPGTPPGTYTVEVVAFDEDTLAPLTAYDALGQPLGPALTLGQVEVTRPTRPTAVATPDPTTAIDTALGSLRLLDVDFDRAEAAPGDPVLVTWLWRCAEDPIQEHVVELILQDSAGDVAAEYALPPTTSSHPTTTWQPGDVWLGQHLVYLPAELESDAYQWRISLQPGGGRVALPASLQVEAPARTFTRPEMNNEVNTALGERFTLTGFDASASEIAPGETITLTLAWRAETETHTSYHVFVHLLDPDGDLIAQADGVPAQWRRPTTGWTPGEYVLDTHTLTLPEDVANGTYTLLAGMYQPGAPRLITPDGEDVIELIQIQVAK